MGWGDDERKCLHNQAIKRGSEGGDERGLNESIMINQEAFLSPSHQLRFVITFVSHHHVCNKERAKWTANFYHFTFQAFFFLSSV